MTEVKPYRERTFALKGLHGISAGQIDAHLELYAGYVKNVNRLNKELAELADSGQYGKPMWSELKRHLAFELNGMRLHEYYFDNLMANPEPPEKSTVFHDTISKAFGGFKAWREEFVNVGQIRGVGWAVLYRDPVDGRLMNHWITLHEEGTLAGYEPILIMDVWEHAFMVDYKVTERAKYIEAFLSNVNWRMCERRLTESMKA